MRNTKFTMLYSLLIIFCTLTHTYAAHVFVQSPKNASANKSPLAVSIFLDTEGRSVSAISGDFSFPSNLFDFQGITTRGSVIALWAVAPHVSEDIFIDGKTHITFEGVIPGGFSGVHTPSKEGVSPGVLFTVILIPKSSGSGSFTVSNVELHNYDENGTVLPSNDYSTTIVVPKIVTDSPTAEISLKEISPDTIVTTFAHSDVIDNGAEYLYIYDTEPSHAIDRILLVESRKSSPRDIYEGEWKKVSNPYVLERQSRTKYIHVKVIYTDNTFSIKTITPVENSRSVVILSRILIGVLVAVLLLLYYGKTFLHFFTKFRT